MKLVALTSAALLAATASFAGNVNYQATPDVPVVVEEVPSTTGGGSTGSGPAWLLPAVGIAAIGAVLLLCHDDDKD